MPHHYTHIEELPDTYAHIYLSPHLDDAALSCGGAIARFVGADQPVLVVNICSGSPPPGALFSPFADDQHRKWGLPPAEAVRRRLAEDVAALATLGADSYQLDLLDAIYRLPSAYRDEATLFGALAVADPLTADLGPTLAALHTRYSNALFYAPLGVGNHVDHQAIYAAALTLAQAGATVAFYEDFPYVAQPGVLEQRLAVLGGPELFMPVVSAIDAALVRKIGAIEAYASQLTTLFGDATAMAAAVGAYAESLRPEQATYGERIWMRV